MKRHVLLLRVALILGAVAFLGLLTGVGLVFSGPPITFPTPTPTPTLTPALLPTPTPTLTPILLPTPTAAPSPTLLPSAPALPTATPQPIATPTPQGKSITVTDNDVTPYLPIKDAWVHFLPNNEIRVGYKILGVRVKCGVAEGKIYLEGVPPWLDLTNIDKNAPTYSRREGNRIILTGIPPWFDLTRFDKDLTKMPTILSLHTEEGQATVVYLP